VGPSKRRCIHGFGSVSILLTMPRATNRSHTRGDRFPCAAVADSTFKRAIRPDLLLPPRQPSVTVKFAVLVNDRLVATCDDLEQAKRAAAACLLRRPAAHPIQKYEEAASETPAVRIEGQICERGPFCGVGHGRPSEILTEAARREPGPYPPGGSRGAPGGVVMNVGRLWTRSAFSQFGELSLPLDHLRAVGHQPRAGTVGAIMAGGN